MSATQGEQQLVDAPVGEEQQEQVDVWPEVVDVELHLPSKQIAFLPTVNVNETLVSIRQALVEFQETAFFTCFKWRFRHILDADNQVIPKEHVGEVLEFSELSSFLEANAKKVVFDLVADLYDAKKAKLHVKRVRDIINRQFLLSAAPSANDKTATASTEAENTAAEDTKSNEKVTLPKIDQLKETVVGNFFQESFKTGVSATALEPAQLPLAGVIKSIFVSGWNPVPAYRRLQGDLMYIEVVFVTEGTFYVTSTARGFYINRSNRATFDPTPANNPHFYHNLFDTLCDLSVNVKNAWTTLCQRSKDWSNTVVPGPLDPVVHGFVNFNGDFSTLPSSTWIIPTGEKSNAKDAATIATPGASYDMLRAQDNLSDLHGAEDFSAPREWNDEIQSIRTLKANDLSSKILKARLEHRMITEFTEACKKIVVAISEGLISPLMYSDPSQSDIYVYNGIFFSRAEDTKDAYSIHVGEEAARKSAARDLLNQKLIRSLEIPNMNNILCTIVDYKGVRYVGQSIIPGILSQGENCAQLMYGIMEKGKAATVKNSSLRAFEELAKKLQLTKRKIPSVPFKADEEAAPVAGEAGHVDALTQLLQTADANQTVPIRVDEVDNVEIDPSTNSLPHCGPIEGKLLRGADGRTYALEMMRLTPRDANYVLAEKGGSARISEEDLLSKMDSSIAPTYVLRQELIGIFMQRRVNLARQALLTELAGKERLLKKDKTEEKKSETVVSVEDVHKDDDEEGGVQIVKEEKPAEEEGQLTEEEQEQLALEYREKFSAITPESLGIEVNPNVFLNFDADVDPAVIAKDEAAAREMAVFLYDSVLPMLTRQVREGDISPKDPESMVNLLHRMGVNMRYLGRLANLAMEQEREDSELVFQNKQRVHSMPYFWLEFLTVELLARAAKHLLNNALKTDSAVASAPAGTVAALLNNFLSILKEPTEAAPETKDGEVAVPAQASTQVAEMDKKTAKKADKKGKKATKVATSSAVADAIGKLEITQVISPVVATKDAFVVALADVLQKKYLYESPLLAKQENADSLDEKAAWRQMQNALLRSRVSPIMLVRRICQQCGIVLACKPFDLKKQAHGPIHVNDIIGLVPKVKSCEPETYLPEVPEMLSSSSSFLNQGNAVAAFELAQQALNFITQITGPTHPQALQATEQLTNVLVNSADYKSAAHMTTRTLAVTAQVQGLDNSSMIQLHLQLAMLEIELGNYQSAFNHLTTAKYVLEVVGGEHHPEMISVLTRLSLLYEKVNDFDSALHSLLRARVFVHDLVNNAGITMAIANLLYRHNRFHEAVYAQKSAYKILKELMSPEDERVVDAKKNLEVYLRAAATAPKPVEYYGGAEQTETAADLGAVTVSDDAEAKKKKNNHKKKAKK